MESIWSMESSSNFKSTLKILMIILEINHSCERFLDWRWWSWIMVAESNAVSPTRSSMIRRTPRRSEILIAVVTSVNRNHTRLLLICKYCLWETSSSSSTKLKVSNLNWSSNLKLRQSVTVSLHSVLAQSSCLRGSADSDRGSSLQLNVLIIIMSHDRMQCVGLKIASVNYAFKAITSMTSAFQLYLRI